MDKLKESTRDIDISRGSEEGLSSKKSFRFRDRNGSSWSPSFKSLVWKPFRSMDPRKRLRTNSSLKLVPKEAHDPREEPLVESLRRSLFLEVEDHLLGKQNDYHTLLRFLRMRNFDVSRAKESFVNYLKWREDYRVDAIPKELNFQEYAEVKKCYPHGYHGVDRYGRPVYIERLGMVDLDALLQVTTIEKFVKYHVAEQEKTLTLRYPACSIAANKHVASTTSIIDVKGVGMSNFSKPARYIFMEIQKIDSNYYPETLYRLYIVNAGSAFRMLWKALKAFLDERTLAKIHVLGYNYFSNLVQVVDPSNLPSFLGGDCTCFEHEGCLFSDKGPWKNPEITNMLQAASADVCNGENGDAALEGPLGPEGSKDAYGKGTVQSEKPDSLRPGYVNKVVTQKFQALEAALQDANAKIQALESALKDTKMVLKGLAEHLEELRV